MCVRAVADDDHTADDVLAISVENATAEFRAQMNIRDIADVDGCSRRGGEDDVLKVRRRANQANSADGHLLVAGFNDLGADVRITALNTLDDRAQGYVVRAQFDGIDVDLILAYPPADAPHFRHAGH